MVDIKKIIRNNILSLQPYSSARDEYEGKEGVFLDANENPYGIYNRYPDPYQRKLKKAVAILKNTPEEHIFLGNGSDEIIDLSFRIFCNPGKDTALSFSPTYGMYEVSSAINDVIFLKVPLDKNFQIDFEKTKPYLKSEQLKLIFICSPNNPTSNSMNTDTVIRILDEFQGVVIIDEAYIDFSERLSFMQLLERYNNLIVMQTFSKAWGMAGVRLGMAFTSPEIIHYFNKVKPPYNISKVNQEAILEKITNTDRFRKEVEIILSERQRMQNELQNIAFVRRIFPSDANFLLAEVTDADKIYNELVAKQIIIRNRSGQVHNCIRITIGTPEENNLLLDTLKEMS